MSLQKGTKKFQPTRPLRGATGMVLTGCRRSKISTHAPLAGRDTYSQAGALCYHNFNPRAPCGARPQPVFPAMPKYPFQPTRPLRGATATLAMILAEVGISTHAPLAGRDRLQRYMRSQRSHFNPRAPCGARRQKRCRNNTAKVFQPTRPLRGATAKEYKSLCTFLR